MGTALAVGLLAICLWATLITANEANPRLCIWTQPRGAIVRETLYLDGGFMQYCQWDSTTDTWLDATAVVPPDQERGFVYKLNLGKRFETSANFSDIFDIDPIAGGISNNPPFMDGYMFADDYEYYTFGGISILGDGEDADLVNYQIWEPEDGGTKKKRGSAWAQDFDTHYLPTSGVNKNTTHGAGVSIPGQHLGFYFSGMQAPDGQFLLAYNRNHTPSVTIDSMVTVDMTTIHDAAWTNSTLPDHVTGRGSPRLTWVPVSDQGLLVAIGGVQDPVDAYGNYYRNATLKTDSLAVSPAFISTASVYDISNGVWYNQTTTGDHPTQLADFCAVVAHEPGSSSYQIYVYGGYDGVDLNQPANSDVYILSIPSFEWTKVDTVNTPSRGRWGHICVAPYPDQMFVIGGQGVNDDPKFARGRVLEVFNMSSLTWKENYDPKDYYNYTIPTQITDAGDPGEVASGMDPALAALFTRDYQGEIVNWYPYASTSSGSTNILGPVLGGVLGGVAVVVAIFIFWLWRRKQKKRKNRESKDSSTGSETLQSNTDVQGWVQDQYKQSVSATAMEMDSSDQATVRSSNAHPEQEIVELGGRRLFPARSPLQSSAPLSPESLPSASVEMSGENRRLEELPDSSPRQEPKSRPDEPDYNPRNHPFYPRVYNDGMSTVDSTIQSTLGPSSAGADGGTSPPNSYQGFSLGGNLRDNYEHVYLGGAALPTKEPIIAPTGQRRIDAYFPSKDRSNFDALPSPTVAERDASDSYEKSRPPNAPRQESNASSDFVITPLAISDPSQQAASHVGMTSAAGPTSPLSPVRPTHKRNESSVSSGGQILARNSPLPSPGLEEDHRQSAFIENLPDSPPADSRRGSPTSPVRRKEVGSGTPTTSAYEENRRRHPED